MNSKIDAEFSFIKPAIYNIKVHGHLPDNWSEKLGGMQINLTHAKDKRMITVLIGQINDQAALFGILNTLYESHLTIISVNMLKDKSE